MSVTCQKDYQITVNETPFEYWKLEEAAAPYLGSVFDSSVSITRGSVSQQSPGKIGNGVFFPGHWRCAILNGVLSPALKYPGDKGFSISGWIDIAAPLGGLDGPEVFILNAATGTYTSNSFAYSLLTSGNFTTYNSFISVGGGTFQFGNIGSGHGAFGEVTPGAWHFFVATYDQIADQVGLYLDNVFGSQPTPPSLRMSSFATQLEVDGSEGSSVSGATDCAFDEIGFWPNHVLSASEVSQMWNGGAGARPPGV